MFSRRHQSRIPEFSANIGVTNSNKDTLYHLYVGNLTWWTSETDISHAILALGVQDFVQVRFFENPINGQSKGFCTVTVGSEKSMRIIMDRLSGIELYGKNPLVTYPTRNNMIMFEAMNPFRSRVGNKRYKWRRSWFF